jgi:hypothetical protein
MEWKWKGKIALSGHANAGSWLNVDEQNRTERASECREHLLELVQESAVVTEGAGASVAPLVANAEATSLDHNEIPSVSLSVGKAT